MNLAKVAHIIWSLVPVAASPIISGNCQTIVK